MPIAYLCDFDGTVSPGDIGAAFVARFSAAGEAARLPELDAWLAGTLGHRELTRAQCRRVRAGEADALEFTRAFGLDPGFAAFAREMLGRGDQVMIVSEGFDFYVRDQLAREGLAELPWAANASHFEGDRVRVEFPFAGSGCGRCGNCKGGHVRAWRARGYQTVLVGDGLSDRCGAREADRVLARRDLLAWCLREGLPVTPFDSFADVSRTVRPAATSGAMPATGGPPAPGARAAGGA